MWLVVKAPDTLGASGARVSGAALPRLSGGRDDPHAGPGFGRLVRERDRAGLAAWLEAADGSGIAEIAGIAAGIRQDRAPVEAALSLEWSAGQTEGQINRLKLIKRQGYGRAGIDLLRKRVLPLVALG